MNYYTKLDVKIDKNCLTQIITELYKVDTFLIKTETGTFAFDVTK